MSFLAFSLVVGLIVGFIAARADLERRKLSVGQAIRRGILSALDVACTGLIAGTLTVMVLAAAGKSVLVFHSPLPWAIVACAMAAVFLWGEGRRQIQFQRPPGVVLGESLILAGTYDILQSAVFTPTGMAHLVVSTGSIVTGVALLGVIVPRFKKVFERHRILERLAQQDEFEQREYVAATPECPRPDRWRMVDPQTCEVEILEFLRSLVTTVKPQLIVETGTFIGHSAIKMAEGLKANGFGRIITIEFDRAAFAKAKERIDASGLAEWIEYRKESSLEAKIEGTIDLFFSDSQLLTREQELRHFLPQISPCGLILVHDASSEIQKVREAMLQMEQEGLISTVLLSTPRGLAIAQKKEGRK